MQQHIISLKILTKSSNTFSVSILGLRALFARLLLKRHILLIVTNYTIFWYEKEADANINAYNILLNIALLSGVFTTNIWKYGGLQSSIPEKWKIPKRLVALLWIIIPQSLKRRNLVNY